MSQAFSSMAYGVKRCFADQIADFRGAVSRSNDKILGREFKGYYLLLQTVNGYFNGTETLFKVTGQSEVQENKGSRHCK